MITGKFFDGTEDLTDAHNIRRKVFVEEQKVTPEEEFDDNDEKAIHVVAYDAGKAVATARLAVIDNHYKIGRVAVLKEERGKKYGDFVVRMLADKAFASGIDTIYVGAQTQAIGFYETIGFEVCSEEFDEAGIPHKMMKMPESSFRRCQGCQV